ncbi:MAG: glycine oxidase ThiO [Candidatus Thiodiazotropha sp.]
MHDCIIIGGGLIGMLTARELAMAGRQVLLIEQGQTGRESSWAGGGIISPLYPWRYHASITALASWSQRHYPALADALQAEGGIDPEYIKSGLLIIEPEDIEYAMEWAGSAQQILQKIDQSAARNCEPALKTEFHFAAWMPEVAQIRNPRLAKSAYHSIHNRVEIRQQTQVTGFLTHGDQIRGVSTASENIPSACVIVCAGAWTGNLLQEFIPPPKIEPVLGQMILFRTDPGTISRIVLHQDRYVIPRRDGRVLVGSTLEYRGFDKSTSTEAKNSLTSFALKHFPQLSQYEMEHHWAGLRPGSPQGIPYIGPVPGVEGLYLNAGHFRNGVVLGPASARLMADLVLGREPIVPPVPYAIDAPRDKAARPRLS